MPELLVKKKHPDQSLDELVSALDGLIGCSRWEEHESSNYTGGRYSLTAALGVEIKAMLADDAEFTDYDFCLWFTPEANPSVNEDVLIGLLDCGARKLAVCRYEVARPFSSRPGSGAMRYRLDPKAGEMPWEQVVTEPVLDCD